MKCWKFHETDLGQKVENDPHEGLWAYFVDNGETLVPTLTVDGAIENAEFVMAELGSGTVMKLSSLDIPLL